MAGWQNSPFAGAQIDFSPVGRLYDQYTAAQAQALQQEKIRQDMAYQQQQRGRASSDEAALKSVLADESIYDESGNFNAQAAASRLLKAGYPDAAAKVAQTGATLNKGASLPSSAQEFEYFSRLTPDQQAQWKELNVRGVGGSSSGQFGKTGAVVQGGDGQFYTVQFGADGTRKIEPLQTPSMPGDAGDETPPQVVRLAPSRGVETVGDTIIDKATGQPVRNVGDALSGGEAAKVRGKTQGEGEAALPKIANALAEYELKSETVLSDIDRAAQQANGWTTGFVGSKAASIEGTPAHDLSKTLVGIQSNLGFETLEQMRNNSPTGGALGQVTERELELLQSTWGSLAQSQSKGQFLHNLSRLKQIKQQFAQLKRQAYEADVKRFGAAAVPNPETGQSASSGVQAAPAPASTQRSPVRVNSPEEARRLPSGTTFVDPNGNVRQVP